jgi:putative oxidoreductase
MNAILKLWRQVDALLAMTPHTLTALIARIAIAQVFWFSGRTKVEGLFTLKEGTVELFREEYQIPFLSPEIAAPLAATAEHVLPILLVLGLGARLAALGLLGMTAVIQLFVYPDAWTVHILWAAVLLSLVRDGGGAIALDSLRR